MCLLQRSHCCFWVVLPVCWRFIPLLSEPVLAKKCGLPQEMFQTAGLANVECHGKLWRGQTWAQYVAVVSIVSAFHAAAEAVRIVLKHCPPDAEAP